MTEITCGACGSPNPTQSRYCNRCGAPLTSDTTQLCPTCDTPNPINLLYCDNCGTRLVDDSEEQDSSDDEDPRSESLSQPFSLPARPPGQTGNLDVSSDLPDWLVTGDFEDDDFQDLSEEEELRWLRAAREGETWEDDDAPTLEELSSGHAPQDDLPTWLMDEESEGAIFSGDKSTDELFMESLGSGEPHDSDEGEEPEEDEPAPDESEATLNELESWLTEMEGDQAEAVIGDDETVDDVEESVPPPAEAEESDWPQSPPEELSEDNFLQWLSEIDVDETGRTGDTGDAPSGSADVPDWLSGAIPDLEADFAGERERSEGDEETPDIADSLTDESEAGDELVAAADAETEQAEDSETIDDDIPEDDFLQWLDSLDDAVPGMDSDEATLQAPGGEEQPAAELPGEELESPESLSDAPDAPETEADEAIAEFKKEDFALPDWLGELSDVEGDAEEVTISGANELPSWLQDLAPPGGDVRLPYVTGSEAELAAEDEDEAPGAEPGPESEAQAWLDEDDVQAGELPDWLDAIRPEEGQMGEEPVGDQSFESTRESDADLLPENDDIQEGELPDWLDGVTSELDALPQATSPDDEYQEEEAAAQDEFALTEDSEHDFATHIEDDLEEQVSADDLPDWFSDVLADIETAEEEKAASDAERDRQSVPEQLAGSELPNWLDSPFSEDEEAAEPTPIEEIPEWLRTPLQEKLAQAAAARGIDEATFEGGEEWRDLLETPPPPTEHAHGDADREKALAWLEEMKAKAPSEEDVE
ncbi:MAG: double zinc ribbon domain-containing protein, partial [Chloroflexota bacterium]